MDNVTMWTAQTSAVADTIERDGISYVKKEYIHKKYGETAWVFETAYAYFRQKMQRLLPRPEEAESPIWLFKDPKWTGLTEDTVLLEFHIPREEIVFFDRRKWTQILNLSYVGSEEEREEFDKELERQGISHVSDLFRFPHYPFLKSKVVRSWDSLFEADGLEDRDIQGAVWQLKKEWL